MESFRWITELSVEAQVGFEWPEPGWNLARFRCIWVNQSTDEPFIALVWTTHNQNFWEIINHQLWVLSSSWSTPLINHSWSIHELLINKSLSPMGSLFTVAGGTQANMWRPAGWPDDRPFATHGPLINHSWTTHEGRANPYILPVSDTFFTIKELHKPSRPLVYHKSKCACLWYMWYVLKQ